MNAMSETRLKEVYPPLAEAVRYMYEELVRQDIVIRVTSGYRSFKEQEKLYAQGRTAEGKRVTNARPGHSMHNFGLAVDLAPGIIGVTPWKPDWNDKSPSWQQMLRLGMLMELECGGNWRNFPDLPHYQWGKIPVTPTTTMRNDYHRGGLHLVWDKVRNGKYMVPPTEVI
jgi:peptidoglycan L-alanyl-D-glutamate endopeptidase CwlK